MRQIVGTEFSDRRSSPRPNCSRLSNSSPWKVSASQLVCVVMAVLFCTCQTGRGLAAERPQPVAAPQPWVSTVLADQPALWLRFSEDGPSPLPAEARKLDISPFQVQFRQDGPQPDRFALLPADNRAGGFHGRGARLIIQDPGTESLFDFASGDELTIEAWVNPQELGAGRQVYLVGKGRTATSGAESLNQNWALRLRETNGAAGLSFLFRSAASGKKPGNWHRWTTSSGFPVPGGWHHVAISYQFGQPDSIRGYIDGQLVTGRWDMGGATTAAPVVDNSPVWVGSSMGGNPGSSFHGLLDELAIYRRMLSAERIGSRYVRHISPRQVPSLEELPLQAARVDWYEKAAAGLAARPDELVGRLTSYQAPALAFAGVPRRYGADGLVQDHRPPLLMRAATRFEVPVTGEYRFLLRSFNAARLRIDGRIVATTDAIRAGGGGHEDVPEADDKLLDLNDVCPPLPGHQHRIARVTLEAGPHVAELDAIAGGAKIRAETGELLVAISRAQQPWRLLAPVEEQATLIDEAGWLATRERILQQLTELNAGNRQLAGGAAAAYWQRRHDWARNIVESLRPKTAASVPEEGQGNPIDRFLRNDILNGTVAAHSVNDDLAFLRRVSLDVRGIVPTLAEIRRFQQDGRQNRREAFIELMLSSQRRADHWTSFWQDLLAENPGILKPKLNNSGPFRWWIHEALLDNRPLDRFITELVLMQGSLYEGGPAGFALASQNDAPLAAKGHTLATAFLAVDLTCARCHDAPFHPWKQKQLFSLAAMLKRQAQEVPATSTVPGVFAAQNGPDAGEETESLVRVTLAPGASVEPEWPFPGLLDPAVMDDLPEWVLRNPADTRERLAVLLTHPRNLRTAEVLVNRLWQRYFGKGLVSDASDWHEAEVSRPDLLRWLAVEFASSGYDQQQISRLILNSRTWQQAHDQTTEPVSTSLPQEPAASGGAGSVAERATTAAPVAEDLAAGRVILRARRRMSAEQLLDSLFVVAGKSFDSEELNLDPEGRRPITTFLNLGTPTRSWQLTSLSNERDRPALAMPRAQSLLDVLAAFGWRETRQNPLGVREETPTVLQPLMLANGTVAQRIVVLSDDSTLTALCLNAATVEELTENLLLTILGRMPSASELEMVESLLGPDFETRKVAGAPLVPVPRRYRQSVSWSNHLSPEATTLKLELEEMVRRGDPPTRRLEADWRQRAEDLIWALLNSPEFLFIP
ncbi:MAG: DUF1553 domain-containing protein [Planctomycetaceae bacterium]|nr:DUF1553 domain-containing protein [Planctomycetaceae bacterium]